MAFLNLNNLDERELLPGFKVRFVHSDTMTLAYWTIDEGAELPEHSHHHEQVLAAVMEGEFEITVDGEAQIVRPGDVVVIPSNVVHSGRALTNCKMLDVFQPVREDYL
ncbi:MAG: cupin domain-containing protein [Calditrichota bacterium]